MSRVPEEEYFLSVSDVNELLNRTLSDSLPILRVRGELSQCTRAASGHWYMTLKDDSSQVALVAWRSTAARFSFTPEQGAEVLCIGKPSVYSGTGRLQLVVQRLLLAGEGALQQEFLRLKEKLEKEGLFRDERKRELPFFPKALGVITSRSGAVIHDIMTKVRERLSSLPVFLIDVRVQGEGAALEIACAIERFNRLNNVDIIIVARGGGSLEDLWAFNEEQVARAIAASRIPVISGVGHETDITLSDLAADVRAPTPTAAAELAVPRRDELFERIARLEKVLLDFDVWFYPLGQRVDDIHQRLERGARRALNDGTRQLQVAISLLQRLKPTNIVRLFFTRISLLREKLSHVSDSSIQRGRARVESLVFRVRGASPKKRVAEATREVKELERRITREGLRMMSSWNQKVDQLERQIRGLEIDSVLRRGFSIVRSAQGEVIVSSSNLKQQEKLSIQFARGQADVKVENTREEQ